MIKTILNLRFNYKILKKMKIGYPCINNQIGCTSNHTFRLASFSEERLFSTVKENLACLKKILEWNVQKNLLFFRIGSQLVPFASHPICQKVNWQKKFAKEFKEVGDFIKKNKIRISVHPDQFVILNSFKEEVLKNSIMELLYHAEILDLMNLKTDAKIQIHVGGAYGDKKEAIKRFIFNYKKLPSKIKRRLVIENDHRLFSLKDVLEINRQTKVPILFDFFHHQCLNNGESLKKAFLLAQKTWIKKDGIIMTDYSNQEMGAILGKHSQTLNLQEFKKFLKEMKNFDFDIMFEIKDKEKSALKSLKLLKN
jgi:UV DNA damage endonuclease